nr:MAG TPA: hypothetical protein [Herelleviridae sp.]
MQLLNHTLNKPALHYNNNNKEENYKNKKRTLVS